MEEADVYKQLGPGQYPIEKIEKRLLSQSQSLKVFTFGKSDRDLNT